MELFGGMREACDEYALWLVGGDLVRAAATSSIAVTVTGEVAPGRAVHAVGRAPGDRVVVTGELGGSAAGLRVARTRRRCPDERQLAAGAPAPATDGAGRGGARARPRTAPPR